MNKGHLPWSNFGVTQPLISLGNKTRNHYRDLHSKLGPKEGTERMVSNVQAMALVPKRIGRLSSLPNFRESQGSQKPTRSPKKRKKH